MGTDFLVSQSFFFELFYIKLDLKKNSHSISMFVKKKIKRETIIQ